ncbi:MAG: DUF4345 domain-containing protein [Cytophagales bacterium]|nr:DUF4345 domain-containing protein [Cytophagales bacterium]
MSVERNKTDHRGIFLSERIAQACLILFAAISIFGGSLQMYLGEPETTPRLDNIHRFMAGVYLACGIISFWTALNIKNQKTLVLLIALGALLGGTGRIISMSNVGLPEPHSLWLTYLSSEFILPLVIIIAQIFTNRRLKLIE